MLEKDSSFVTLAEGERRPSHGTRCWLSQAGGEAGVETGGEAGVEKGTWCPMSKSSPDGTPASPAMFSQVDVSAGGLASSAAASADPEQTELLREMLAAQDRTNEILEELVGVMASAQKQRHQELAQWRKANPRLAASCRDAAEALSRVQAEYLERITDEINETSDEMVAGEFVLNEFVDRFGPRLAHLNGVIQVLAQLSSVASSNNR